MIPSIAEMYPSGYHAPIEDTCSSCHPDQYHSIYRDCDNEKWFVYDGARHQITPSVYESKQAALDALRAGKCEWEAMPWN